IFLSSTSDRPGPARRAGVAMLRLPAAWARNSACLVIASPSSSTSREWAAEASLIDTRAAGAGLLHIEDVSRHVKHKAPRSGLEVAPPAPRIGELSRGASHQRLRGVISA